MAALVPNPTPLIVISPEPFGYGYDVEVIPSPQGVGHDRECRTYREARDYALGLAEAHGWQVRDLAEAAA